MEPADYTQEELFSQQVEQKEKRKMKALSENKQSIWTGLSMFGMVGWSVTVPTLLGVFLGIWLDKKDPESISWTMTFLIIGLSAGCLVAWHWVSSEHKDMNQINQ